MRGEAGQGDRVGGERASAEVVLRAGVKMRAGGVPGDSAGIISGQGERVGGESASKVVLRAGRGLRAEEKWGDFMAVMTGNGVEPRWGSVSGQDAESREGLNSSCVG